MTDAELVAAAIQDLDETHTSGYVDVEGDTVQGPLSETVQIVVESVLRNVTKDRWPAW